MKTRSRQSGTSCSIMARLILPLRPIHPGPGSVTVMTKPRFGFACDSSVNSLPEQDLRLGLYRVQQPDISFLMHFSNRADHAPEGRDADASRDEGNLSIFARNVNSPNGPRNTTWLPALSNRRDSAKGWPVDPFVTSRCGSDELLVIVRCFVRASVPVPVVMNMYWPGRNEKTGGRSNLTENAKFP